MSTPITQEAFDAVMANRALGYYPDDTHRIVAVAKRELGINMTTIQAQYLWATHSDDYCASWLIIDDGTNGDKQIVKAIRRFVEERG